MNVIEAKSPHKTWNNWRQRCRLWYKQENPPSAKRSGEEASALNDRREKIRQSRKKKGFVDIVGFACHIIGKRDKWNETSELGKVWPISYLTIQFFFSFLFFSFLFLILFWGTIHVWSQLFSNPPMDKQGICHKRLLPPTCFVLQFFFDEERAFTIQPKLDDIQLAALSFFPFFFSIFKF